MQLYYHKTDGGAEYLCSSPVEGTEEGSFKSDYIVRIDGDLRKDAELTTYPATVTSALYVALDTLSNIADEGLDMNTFNKGGIGFDAIQTINAAIAKAKGTN